jgi:CRISPR-associated protein Cas2
MPFTVITLKKVPPSLRGDLTKWMQEIATGVYIGNFSTRVRENLWQRVCDAVGAGEATISYAYRNEIGYDFQTLNTERCKVDFDGIPLVFIPAENDSQRPKQNNLKKGFSTAYKRHRYKRTAYPHKSKGSEKTARDQAKARYVVLDLETTGLDVVNDRIIEIGAVKDDQGSVSVFNALIRIDAPLPKEIMQLTGITDAMLSQGRELKAVLCDMQDFIQDFPIVGYNINFDMKFLNHALNRCDMPGINNPVMDLMKTVRREQLFQENYRLETTLKSYGIAEKVPHRALEDAKLIFELSKKVNVFSRTPN